jgi:Holliday junction resolvasome RuvABC ATP-dependent DNA helicase subunit
LQINVNNDFGNRATSGAVVPLKPNSTPHFTGRADILDKLKEFFSRGNSDELGTRKHFLLYGMGGIGKTTICLEFIEDMSDQ